MTVVALCAMAGLAVVACDGEAQPAGPPTGTTPQTPVVAPVPPRTEVVAPGDSEQGPST